MQKSEYKEPKIYTANNNLEKQWYVEFAIWNNKEQKYNRVKEYVSTKLNAADRKKELIKIKNAVEKLLKDGKIKPKEKKTSSLLTLKDVFDLLTTHNQSRPKDTASRYNNIYSLFFSVSKNAKTASLTPEFCENTLHELQHKNGFENERYNFILSRFKSDFKTLHKKGLITNNPFALLDKKPTAESDIEIWSKEHLNKWFTYAKTDCKQLLITSYLIYHCFLRMAEITRLQCGDVILNENLIRIKSANAKNKKSRFITMSNTLAKLLESEIKDAPSNYFIVGKKYSVSPDKLHPERIYKTFYRHRKKIQLPSTCTLYKLKHTGNTEMLGKGATLLQLVEQNRHSSIKQTEVYAKKLKQKANPIFKDMTEF